MMMIYLLIDKPPIDHCIATGVHVIPDESDLKIDDYVYKEGDDIGITQDVKFATNYLGDGFINPVPYIYHRTWDRQVKWKTVDPEAFKPIAMNHLLGEIGRKRELMKKYLDDGGKISDDCYTHAIERIGEALHQIRELRHS